MPKKPLKMSKINKYLRSGFSAQLSLKWMSYGKKPMPKYGDACLL